MRLVNYQPKRHIAIIESARGFAALYVVLTHIVEMLYLPTLYPPNSYITIAIDLLMIYGDQAVLLFFVLSGFSIHYTSVDRDLSHKNGLINYYYLRWRRIYPIFLIAIILGYCADLLGFCLFTKEHQEYIKDFDLTRIVCTLSFLTDRPYINGMIMPVPHGNAPLWSLSYEVFYYLIYPAYWYVNKRWGFINAAFGSFFISLIAFFLGKVFGANHFLNVLNHYVIWCLGAVLAEMHRGQLQFRLPMVLHAPAIYVLLQSAWVLENAVYTVGAIFNITWGLFFFFVMLLFLRSDQPEDMNMQHRRYAVVIATLGYIVIIESVRKLSFVPNLPLFYWHITLTLISFIIGLSFPKLNIINISKLLLKPVYRYGSSSYGIYVLHYPILLVSFGTLYQMGLPAYIGILVVPLILYLANLIELKIQPFVVTHLDAHAKRLGLISPQKRIAAA